MPAEATLRRRETDQSSERPSVRNPLDPRRPIHAVLFDLDGTLYDQRRMRMLMAAELLRLGLRRPMYAPRILNALRTYRREQELLRSDLGRTVDLTTQIDRAAARTGLTVTATERVVDEWMFQRPLKHMPACRAHDLLNLLAFLDTKGLPIGVLSDYPPAAKLRALGLDGRFETVLCATDPDVGAFKPNPRGFLRACERWRLQPGEVLVVGDRVDVDGRGAVAAGMPCVIVGRSWRISMKPPDGVLLVSSLERLRRVLDNGC